MKTNKIEIIATGMENPKTMFKETPHIDLCIFKMTPGPNTVIYNVSLLPRRVPLPSSFSGPSRCAHSNLSKNTSNFFIFTKIDDFFIAQCKI